MSVKEALIWRGWIGSVPLHRSEHVCAAGRLKRPDCHENRAVGDERQDLAAGDRVDGVHGGKEEGVHKGDEVVEAGQVVELAEDRHRAARYLDDAAVADRFGHGQDGIDVHDEISGNNESQERQGKHHPLKLALVLSLALGWVERLRSGQ